jgi:hypothetical protein
MWRSPSLPIALEDSTSSKLVDWGLVAGSNRGPADQDSFFYMAGNGRAVNLMDVGPQGDRTFSRLSEADAGRASRPVW